MLVALVAERLRRLVAVKCELDEALALLLLGGAFRFRFALLMRNYLNAQIGANACKLIKALTIFVTAAAASICALLKRSSIFGNWLF